MEAIRNPLWRRDLISFRTVERFESSGLRWIILASPPERSRNERYRYLLYVFEGESSPCLALGMESDILGGWRATLADAAGSTLLARFDEEPAYETWRELAVAAAWDRMSGERSASGIAPKPSGRHSSAKPRRPR